MDLLLNECIGIARPLVVKFGFHAPFAKVIKNDGVVALICVDDSHGPSADEIANEILDVVREGCMNSDFRAVTLARNVEYISTSDGTTGPAIKVVIDHIEGEPVSTARTGGLPIS